MTSEQELELWMLSKERYKTIRECIRAVSGGLQSDGNRDLKIRECAFCEYLEFECKECPYAKKFGECGTYSHSEWMKLHNILQEASNKCKETIEGIEEEIKRLSL